jgi:ABC-type histidine transport system ATPase subunit
MKHFADLNGLICWVKENGESNHPAITSGEQVAKIEGNKILFIKSDGSIQDEFILWDHLTALAAAIERPIHVDPNDSLHIDTAVAIAHSKIEKFRSDWHSGHIANTECYPLSIESENTGIFFEQMFDAITSN